jgi:hypothetical protein
MGGIMTDISRRTPTHVVTPTSGRQRGASRFQWRVVDISSNVTRGEAQRVLTDQAEYGQWELARSQVLVGGARRVWLRRRVMRVIRTDAA